MAAKPLSGIDAEEFRVLKLVGDVLWPRLFPSALLQDEVDPRRQLDRFAQHSPTMALKGLRQAINDLLEMTQDFDGAQLEELDRLLRDAGAPTISELRLAHARKVFQILRAGVVTSDEDYRLLAAVLSDVDSPLLSTENRDHAERILASYSGSGDKGA